MIPFLFRELEISTALVVYKATAALIPFSENKSDCLPLVQIQLASSGYSDMGLKKRLRNNGNRGNEFGTIVSN